MKKTNDGAVRWWSEDRGFYMILLLCVAAVAVAAYVLFASPNTAETDPMNGYVYHADDSVHASDTLDGVPAMDAGGDTAQETAGDTTEQKTQTETSAADADTDTAAAAALVFTPPMETDVSRAYSGDTLEYDETTEDWRTHNGADYAGEEGDAVCAIAAGTVTEVGEDAIRGKYVILSHAQDMTSLYTGLKDIAVSEGDSVAGGKQIAVLGTPMPLEEKQGTHLHLEVTKAGTCIDPAQLY